jgi:hypothetical protein
MATRSGGTSTATIGKLSEARQSLEKALGLPVAARMGGGAFGLMVATKTDEDVARVKAFLKDGSSYQRFTVEIREMAKPQDKPEKGKKKQ